MVAGRYQILFAPPAEKSLAKLPNDIQRRIVKAVESLADNPRPVQSKKLQGPEDLYRIRVGDYRVVYDIRDQKLIVLIVRIGHRREIYRDR